MTPTPFTDRTLRDALFASLDAGRGLPGSIAVEGSGPFGREDFTGFLEELGVDVVAASGATEVLVVGRDGWSEDTLATVVDGRSGRRLRIYSQEMLLAFAASGADPFHEGREVVERYGRGHAGLQHLTTIGFDWPTTVVYQSGEDLTDEGWPDESPLRRLGYRVGEDAPDRAERRELLEIALTSPLPEVASPSYMEKWGQPGSEVRLERIATHLASLCRSFRGRDGEADSPAVARYEDDLEWLEEMHYRSRFAFEWPSTRGE